jgi:hypothetical protein
MIELHLLNILAYSIHSDEHIIIIIIIIIISL